MPIDVDQPSAPRHSLGVDREAHRPARRMPHCGVHHGEVRCGGGRCRSAHVLASAGPASSFTRIRARWAYRLGGRRRVHLAGRSLRPTGIWMWNSPQHVECTDCKDEDGPQFRDVPTDEAEDGDTEEDEPQHHGQRRMVEGPGDAGEEDHDRSLSLDL